MPATNVLEIKIRTGGFPGAPGWTTLYFDGDDTTTYDDAFRAARALMVFAGGSFPSLWSAVVQPEGRVLLASTGALETIVAIPDDGTSDPVVGTLGSSFGAGLAGLCVSWGTAGVNWTRRVRGRTFFVPLSSGMYQADGTLNDSSVTGWNSGLTTWLADWPNFGVYSRARSGAGGKFFNAISDHVTDQAAYLTSRRH